MLIVPGTTKLEIIRDERPRSTSDRLPLSHLTSFDYVEEYGELSRSKYSLGSGAAANPPKSRLSSANSSDSSVDTEAESMESRQLNQSFPSFAWTKLASMLQPFMQSRTSPSPHEDGSGRASGASSSTSEGFPFDSAATNTKKRLLDELQRTVPTSSTVAGLDVSKEAALPRAPSKSSSSGGRRTSTSGSSSTKSSHERSQTWGSPSDFSVPTSSEKRKISNIPRSVNTPGLSAQLRVQPHVATSESEDLVGVWVPERMFDVFVNPASLPEVFLSLENKGAAILVDLVPVESPSKPPQSKGGDDFNRVGQDSDMGDISRVTPMVEKQQGVGGSEREHRGLPASLVVRLFFATRIRRVCRKICSGLEDGVREEGCQLKALLGGELVVDDERFIDVPVEVDHIVVSELVRHQLGIAMCSGVMVNQVKDEWRLSHKEAPSLHIHPMDPPIQVGRTVVYLSLVR